MKTSPDVVGQRKADTAVLVAVQEPVKKSVVAVVQAQQTLATGLGNTKRAGQHFLMHHVLTDTDCSAEETIYLVDVALVLAATVTNSSEVAKQKRVTSAVDKTGSGEPRDYDTSSLRVGTTGLPEQLGGQHTVAPNTYS